MNIEEQLKSALKDRGYVELEGGAWQNHWGGKFPDLSKVLDDALPWDRRKSSKDPQGAQYGMPLNVAAELVKNDREERHKRMLNEFVLKGVGQAQLQRTLAEALRDLLGLAKMAVAVKKAVVEGTGSELFVGLDEDTIKRAQEAVEQWEKTAP